MSVGRRLVAALALLAVSACGGGGSPTSPSPSTTGPTASAPASCTATYSCPAADGATATTAGPAFERVTLTTGTSASCRVPLPRNTPDPGIQVEFSIRNPGRDVVWRGRRRADNNMLNTDPSFGDANTLGPIRATVRFNPSGLPPLRSGLEFTQSLELELIQLGPSVSFATAPVLASCSVTVYGNVLTGS